MDTSRIAWRAASSTNWSVWLRSNVSLATTRPSALRATRASKAASSSRVVLAVNTSSRMPSAWAAVCNVSVKAFAFGLPGLMIRPNVVAFGTRSRSSPSCFGPSEDATIETPVRLASGRLRLLTSPNSTGSLPLTKTIGIVDVAAFAVCAGGRPPAVKITDTFFAINSAASAGSLASTPSAKRIRSRQWGLSS